MKKTILAVCLLIFIGLCAEAATLYRIRFNHYPDKIRVVLDFDGAFTYNSVESKEEIILLIKGVEAGQDIGNYFEINDLIVKYFEIEKLADQTLKIRVPLNEPVKYNVFYLNDPPRLVIDFDREFLSIVSGGMMADGLEYLKVRKGKPQGQIEAQVLRVDLEKNYVAPALAGSGQPNVIGSIFDFLTPWRPRSPSQGHFYLESVSDICQNNHALAGINGTFFASNGDPLGALIIDGEIVSYPIHDRTAFFLDNNNQPYIDNIFLNASLKITNGPRYKINGINQGRNYNDTILYTPRWGKSTGTNNQGIEMVVSKRRVEEINLADSKIPEDGYVVSLSGPAVETLSEQVKKWEGAQLTLNVISYNTAPQNITQLISGGPRLVKNGYAYVTKHEEKFQPDVAKNAAARTAIGITRDKQLLLVIVKGPSVNKWKKDAYPTLGITLEELAELMKSLGAYQAMNLDGGSSASMVIDGKTYCGVGRRVSNAIIVLPKN